MKNVIATFEQVEFAVSTEGDEFIFIAAPQQLRYMMRGEHAGLRFFQFLNGPTCPAVYRADLVAIQPDTKLGFNLAFASVPTVIYDPGHPDLLRAQTLMYIAVNRPMPLQVNANDFENDYSSVRALIYLHNQRRIRKLDDSWTFVPMDIETLQTVKLETLHF